MSCVGNGRVIVFPVAHSESLRRRGVDPSVPISVATGASAVNSCGIDLTYHRF